ncbi:MAG: ATP-binding cassette domain-containing protein [Emergencia sp.]
MIKLTHVNKYYNRKKSNEIHVINDTSLELESRGLVTFLGSSGCGKTTLLNAIGGLDKVDSGDIFIDGDRMTRRSSGKKDELRNAYVGYIFQNYNLIEDASVFTNVALVLKMMGVKDKAEIEERVMYILKRVGMDRYRNRPARMLSGGERQRVGIARAIVKNPKIIIADEPTGNLDSRNTIEIMNIIKAISRDRLVILVTHEREIAEFYASRIIEIVDGRIVSDRENVHDEQLDMRMENKIYLQDLPVQKELSADNIRIRYYSDREDDPGEIRVVVQNGSLYIQLPGGLKEGSDAVELVDDHYKKLSRDVYEDYEFDYSAMVDDNFRPKYNSVFSPVTMLAAGYRKIFSYSLIKKILLAGFILASMFAIYAVSSIAGITNITDDKFVQVNQNYLTVSGAKITPEMYEKYSEMEGVDYVLPGNSIASFTMPIDDYYQSAGAFVMLSGSLSDRAMADPDAMVAGSLTDGKRDLVIDRMTADELLRGNMVKMIGILSYEDFIGRTVELPDLGEFTITGITDQGSPSVYADRDIMTDILINQPAEGAGDAENLDQAVSSGSAVKAYSAVKDDENIRITGGSAPSSRYEALISEAYRYDYAIGSSLDTRVNGKKLKVCGYYSDRKQRDTVYVSRQTAVCALLDSQNCLVLSPEDKSAVFEELSAQNVKVSDNYADDRESYIESIYKQILATILVSGIILLISLIEMYLMLRSSFLSRIKEVGVLRAIGLKKKDIYRMFAGEIIAMTTMTTLPAMALMAYILNGISKIPYIGDQYLMNPAVFLISFGLVFLFNMIAGLLPVFNTMRKTPAEILSRNDVN